MKCTLALDFIFVTLFTIHFSNIAEGCSCLGKYTHFQDLFCNARILVRGKVVDESITRGLNDFYPDAAYRVYKVRVIKVFKGKKIIRNKKFINVTTEADGAACGAHLTLGDVYLLSDLDLDYCSNEYWKKKTNRFLTRFHILQWLQHCKKCKVRLCFDDYVYYGHYVYFDKKVDCPVKKKEYCTIDGYDRHQKCYDNFGICNMNKGQCEWRKSKKFRECIQKESN